LARFASFLGGWYRSAKQAARVRADVAWRVVTRGRLSIAMGMILAGLAALGVYWTWSVYEVWRFEQLVSVSKTWEPSRMLGNVTVEVTTQCREPALFYTVTIVPPGRDATLTRVENADRARTDTDDLRSRIRAVRLSLVEHDGSPIADYEVPIEEFVRLYSSSEERPATLEARGIQACDARRYMRARELKVTASERGAR
jgi:hypothetical protein